MKNSLEYVVPKCTTIQTSVTTKRSLRFLPLFSHKIVLEWCERVCPWFLDSGVTPPPNGEVFFSALDNSPSWGDLTVTVVILFTLGDAKRLFFTPNSNQPVDSCAFSQHSAFSCCSYGTGCCRACAHSSGGPVSPLLCV